MTLEELEQLRQLKELDAQKSQEQEQHPDYAAAMEEGKQAIVNQITGADQNQENAFSEMQMQKLMQDIDKDYPVVTAENEDELRQKLKPKPLDVDWGTLLPALIPAAVGLIGKDDTGTLMQTSGKMITDAENARVKQFNDALDKNKDMMAKRQAARVAMMQSLAKMKKPSVTTQKQQLPKADRYGYFVDKSGKPLDQPAWHAMSKPEKEGRPFINVEPPKEDSLKQSQIFGQAATIQQRGSSISDKLKELEPVNASMKVLQNVAKKYKAGDERIWSDQALADYDLQNMYAGVKTLDFNAVKEGELKLIRENLFSSIGISAENAGQQLYSFVNGLAMGIKSGDITPANLYDKMKQASGEKNIAKLSPDQRRSIYKTMLSQTESKLGRFQNEITGFDKLQQSADESVRGFNYSTPYHEARAIIKQMMPYVTPKQADAIAKEVSKDDSGFFLKMAGGSDPAKNTGDQIIKEMANTLDSGLTDKGSLQFAAKNEVAKRAAKAGISYEQYMREKLGIDPKTMKKISNTKKNMQESMIKKNGGKK